MRLGAGAQAVGSSSIGSRVWFCLLALGFAGLLALVGPGADTTRAQADGSSIVSVAEAVDRRCYSRELDGIAGVDSVTVPGPNLSHAAFGGVEARLEGPAGSDWDLVVFDGAGEVVAASTSSGASEVASGYIVEPTDLTVQACRISGEGTDAALSVESYAVEDTQRGRTSLVNVKTPTPQDVKLLQSLGLDLTEHGGENYVAVVLHGREDRALLDKVGLRYEVDVANLARQSARLRAADRRYARQTTASSLPSGRDTYRRLFHYTDELKELAQKHPDLVRHFTLPHETWEGRTVEGIEITTDADNVRDGKPIYLQMGLHHAREWPSGEHAMEWAYELIKGYKAGNARVRGLVENTRTIIVPVVNPDGFNASREAGEQQGGGGGRDGSDIALIGGNIVSHPNEYRRKNCRFPEGEGGSCTQPSLGLAALGVDPNRNYGAFWAGPGASGDPTNETYYGPGPFSEPETQNIRELISERQVTVLITNHTFSNLVLRPPGLASEPPPVDDAVYTALGDSMARQNGYTSQRGYELYDTSGTTEDWSYNATGGLGYTFEIGCNGAPTEDPIHEEAECIGNFHPTFPKVVAEYEGMTDFARAVGGEGKGNREAYFLAHEAAADPNLHSVLQGGAPPGAILRLEKTFEMPTRADDPASFTDHLETVMKVPDSGNYDWHINPSTRPLVAQERGRPAAGPPPTADPDHFEGAASPTNQPCADYDTEDPNCFDDHPFLIPDSPSTDVDSASVRIEWETPASDYDLKVFQDTDGDGTSLRPDGPDEGTDPDSEPLVGESGQGGTDFEETTFVKPETANGQLERGKYVARVINWAAVEPYTGTITLNGPEEHVLPKTETWRFTCTYNGDTRVRDDILINRGEVRTLDLAACGTGEKRASCQGKSATLVGTKKNDTIVGTKERDVILALGGRDKIRSRGGKDIICSRGGKDKISSGGGKDKVKAGGGRDRANGGAGKDRLVGGRGGDELNGKGGGDKLRGGAGRDVLRGGGGEDRCVVKGGGDKVNGCEKD